MYIYIYIDDLYIYIYVYVCTYCIYILYLRRVLEEAALEVLEKACKSRRVRVGV
jgi:hypothetical protein